MGKFLEWMAVVVAWCIAPHELAHGVELVMERHALGLADPSDRAEFIRYGRRIIAVMVYGHAVVFGIVFALILSAVYTRFF